MPDRRPTDEEKPGHSEVVARRALGIALNQFWSNEHEERSIAPIDPPTADAAIAVLLDRVPPGPERERAVEIVRRSTRPLGHATAWSAGGFGVDGWG